MINSCSECKTKCCKIGPGPHKSVPVLEWMESQNLLGEIYNTRCENFNMDTEQCSLWNKPEMPGFCRTFICHNREYSEQELSEIRAFEEEPCLGDCGRKWKIKGVACNLCGEVG